MGTKVYDSTWMALSALDRLTIRTWIHSCTRVETAACLLFGGGSGYRLKCVSALHVFGARLQSTY
ncbi:unnamed protein product [Ixodes persulcatus]